MEKCGTILNSRNLFSIIPLQLSKAIHPLSTPPLASPYRVSQIAFHPTLPYLFVQSNERSVEVFRVRSDDDIRKKQAHNGAEEVELADLFTPYLIVRATGKIKSFALPEETLTKGATQVRYHDLTPRLASYGRLTDLFCSIQQRLRSV